jgi:hypothetical protein
MLSNCLSSFPFELGQPEQYIIGIFYELNGLTD